jgi:integrase
LPSRVAKRAGMNAYDSDASFKVRQRGAEASFVLLVETPDGSHEIVLHARRGCGCGCRGGWDERGARAHLHNTLALIRAGLWRPQLPPRGRTRRGARRAPTFERFALRWLRAKRDGTIGPTNGIAATTAASYRSALVVHLLPFFGHLRLDQITREACLEFKAMKVRHAREVREALAAGVDLRDRYGRRAKPLSPSSIRKLIDVLGMILDEAVFDGFIPSNPARGRRMRIRVPRPSRLALEIDELAALFDAAAALDRQARPVLRRADFGLTTRLVELQLGRGRRPHQIAADLRLARSTVSWHLRRIGAAPSRGYVARRVVCELLGRAGLRAAELCDLRIGDIRLDAPSGAHLRVRESKTDAGVREVQISPDLRDTIIEHLARLHEAGLPHGLEAFLVPSTTGTRMSTRRVRTIVSDVLDHANETRRARGLPPLPAITPHALRRTYVSIALLANDFDVKGS